MKQLLNKWLNNSQLLNYRLNFGYFVHALFGHHCIICGVQSDAKKDINIVKSSLRYTRQQNDALQPNISAACSACLEGLPWHSNNSCPQCGLEISGAGLNQTTCGGCINSPPHFDVTRAVFLYQFPIDAMMVRYKYGHSLNFGDIFAEFLAEKVDFTGIDLVVPMPMHPQRLKQRSFNQALEIAKVLTKNCKEKLDFKSTIRQTLTPPQASLPLKERVKNIKGAFNVNEDRLNQIQGRRIAIVDDVMTTGASLNELAKTLKKAGASHVECWVIARTLPHK